MLFFTGGERAWIVLYKFSEFLLILIVFPVLISSGIIWAYWDNRSSWISFDDIAGCSCADVALAIGSVASVSWFIKLTVGLIITWLWLTELMSDFGSVLIGVSEVYISWYASCTFTVESRLSFGLTDTRDILEWTKFTLTEMTENVVFHSKSFSTISVYLFSQLL